jgi:transcription initiation factor TFIID subunit TAF12
VTRGSDSRGLHICCNVGNNFKLNVDEGNDAVTKDDDERLAEEHTLGDVIEENEFSCKFNKHRKKKKRKV